MRTRSSIIWKTPREELLKLVESSNSISDILRKLGYTNIEGNHRTLKDRLKAENINTEELTLRGKNLSLRNLHTKNDVIPESKIFVENSNFCRKHLKNRILNLGLIVYECRDCKNNGSWNAKSLSLHLEHINGIGNDNRLENLCFLCPNCHSQTNTYAGKKNKQTKRLSVARTCSNCGNRKDRQAEMCRQCYRSTIIEK